MSNKSNNISNDPGSHNVSFDPGNLSAEELRALNAPSNQVDSSMSGAGMRRKPLDDFRAVLSNGSTVATLTWTPIGGQVEIQKLVNGVWTTVTTVNGRLGTATDTPTTYPDPVSYRARVLGSSVWQTLNVSAGEFIIFQFPDLHSRNQATSTRTFDWLVANFATMGGKLIICNGDLVSDPADNAQWTYIMGQLERLRAASIPMVLCPGNHDWLDANKTHWNSRLDPHFWHLDNPALIPNFETMTASDTFNTAMRWTFNGVSLVFIGMAANVGGSWTAQHQWALGVARKYPSHYAVMFTHAYLDNDGTLQDPLTGNYLYGDKIYEEAVSQAPNVIAIHCGHTHTAYKGWWHLVQLGINGNRIDALNIDTQDFANGGDDYLRMYRWKPDQNLIVATTIRVVQTITSTSYFSTFLGPTTLSSCSPDSNNSQLMNGDRVRIADANNANCWVEGVITDFDGTDMTINGDTLGDEVATDTRTWNVTYRDANHNLLSYKEVVFTGPTDPGNEPSFSFPIRANNPPPGANVLPPNARWDNELLTYDLSPYLVVGKNYVITQFDGMQVVSLKWNGGASAFLMHNGVSHVFTAVADMFLEMVDSQGFAVGVTIRPLD